MRCAWWVVGLLGCSGSDVTVAAAAPVDGGAPPTTTIVDAGGDGDVDAPVSTDASTAEASATGCPTPVAAPGPSDITACVYQGATCGETCGLKHRWSCPKQGQPRDVVGCVQIAGGACCAEAQCFRYSPDDYTCEGTPMDRRYFYRCPPGAAPIAIASECSNAADDQGMKHCCSRP